MPLQTTYTFKSHSLLDDETPDTVTFFATHVELKFKFAQPFVPKLAAIGTEPFMPYWMHSTEPSLQKKQPSSQVTPVTLQQERKAQNSDA